MDFDNFGVPIGGVVLGLLAIIGGVVYGYSSHQVSFRDINTGTMTPYFVTDGTDYFHAGNTTTYYVIHEHDFTPAFSGPEFSRNCLGGFSFVAHTDGQNIDVTLTKDSGGDKEYQGTGYTVVEISCYDSSGQITKSYRTAEYSQHPNGYYDNRWIIATYVIWGGTGLAALSTVALLIMLFAVLLSSRAKS